MNKNMIMIIDILPSSDLKISKYLLRHNVEILPNLYKEIKSNKCQKRNNCMYLHELVRIKEFMRDDKLNYDIELSKIPNKNIIIENGHIANMAYIKMMDKKMFKIYMREFKHRKHTWNYSAIVYKNKNYKNEYDKKLAKELSIVLKQSQIQYTIVGKPKITLTRKEILKQIQSLKNPVNEGI